MSQTSVEREPGPLMCRAAIVDPGPREERNVRGPDDEDELSRGRALGRYVVLDRLGRGAMGSVYAAYDPELMRRVAVKVLRTGAVARQGHEAARQRLLREAQALARLAHPNVVRVFDVGTDEGRVFLAMELVEGQSLRRWLEVPRSWREVVEVLEQAGRGLAAAHALGLVHRDFKPDNVLVAADGRVRVGDFGLVRRFDDSHAEHARAEPEDSLAEVGALQTAEGDVLGTPAYMAPEQHAGEEAEPRSDQYAFCVTLFEALHGRRPFGDDDPHARVEAKQQGLGIDAGPQGTAGRVPASLRAVVRRGLSPAPADRYPTMEPLLDALARVRARASTWRAVAVTGVVALGCVGMAVAGQGRAPTPCTDAGVAPSAAWSEVAREAVRQRLREHLAADEVERAVAGIERRVGAWGQAHRDACEDTWVRGEQSSARLDARMDCLRGQWAELEETVALLRDADGPTAARSSELVLGLPSPGACAHEPPRDRARAADPGQAEATRRSLARVAALRRAARYDEAWAELQAWDEGTEPAAVEEPTQEAAARAHARGMVLDDRGLLEQSEAAHRHALHLARAARDDRGEADAWLGLASAADDRLHDPERARFYAQMAAAAVAAVGGDERIESWAETLLGSVAFREGDDERARAHWERALALREALYGEEHPLTVASLNNLGGVLYGQGELDDAAEALRRALELRERMLGPDHPDVAGSAINLGLVLVAQGRTAEAVRWSERALEIQRRRLGDDHPLLVNGHDALAQALLADGQAAAAREHFERARALVLATMPPRHPTLVSPLLGLAEIELQAGAPGRAEAWAREALEVTADDALDPLLEVQAQWWLAQALAEQDRRDEARQAASAARAGAEAVGERGQELRVEIEAWLGVVPGPAG
jgi:tetratricopeptide (TPR) repeat protein/predicted Ser/Thr protein kinase